MFTNPTIVNVPLRQDEKGAVRVGDTRVLLEMVIYAFEKGKHQKILSKVFRA